MSTDLAVRDEAVKALLAQQEDDLGDVSFQTPILKVCQSLTKEVKSGDAEAGEFFNTLTGESYGTKIEFVVAYFQRGRSASIKDGRYRNVIAQDLIPDDDFWKDLLGEEFVGTRFDEHPDAEEQYKRRVNAGDIEWGKGPLISTTYNYTGLVLPSSYAVEGDEDAEPLPVRVSFLRSTKSAHDKLVTLKRATMRNKAFWDVVFELATEEKAFGRNTSHIVTVKKGRATTPDEVTQAIDLAQAVNAGRTVANEGAEQDVQVAPDAAGGLAV